MWRNKQVSRLLKNLLLIKKGFFPPKKLLRSNYQNKAIRRLSSKHALQQRLNFCVLLGHVTQRSDGQKFWTKPR